MERDRGETPTTRGLGATASDGARAVTQTSAPSLATAGDVAEADLPRALPARDPERYERVAEHARGGLGQIWRATDRDLGRTVALKELLRPSQTGEARFVREALLTARLEHPSIVAVHDAGRTAGGHPFYTMKMVSGRSLGEVIRSADRFEERLAHLPHAIAVADAIAYAHSHRVIHRDLKPSNVLVGDFGETVVVDWGLAKELGDDDTANEADAGPYRVAGSDDLTRTGSVLGTPAYMAPEQARGEAVDERADVYSLGALLYHMLAGRAPYSDGSAEDLLQRVLDGPPTSLIEIAPAAPADLVAIVRKSMAREPGERYPSARELADDLRRFQTGKLVSVHGYSLGELVRRWYRRHRTPIWIGAVALIALAVVGVVSVRRVVAARAVADRRLTASLVEQGRRALLADDYRASATYLSRAYSRGAAGPGVRVMLPLAARPLDAEKATLVHPTKIWEVNYSADGRLLLVTAEGAVHLWDGRTGAYVRSFRGHTKEVRVARFSPAADFVVSGGDDQTARIWRTSDGVEEAVLEHDALIDDVAVSPDATRIATATVTGTVRIWSREGRLEHTVDAHKKGIWRVLFSPDGSLLASAGKDGLAALWDPATGALVHELRGHTAMIRNLAFSPNGDRLLTLGADHVAMVWDTTSGARLLTLTGQANALIGGGFSPDGTRIVTSGLDPQVNLWNAVDGSLVQTLRGHTGAVYWSAFTPDGQAVVTVSWDGTARLWDAATGTEQLIMAGHEGPAVWGALSPDGSTLATDSWDGTVRLWDTTRRAELARFRATGSAAATDEEANVDVSGKRVLGCTSGGSVLLASRDGAGRTIDTGHQLASCEFSPDGKTFATASFDGLISLRDSDTGRALHELAPKKPGRAALSISFQPDGRRVASGGSDGVITLWSPATGEVSEFRAHDDVVFGLDFSSDGRLLLTGGGDGRTKLWDLGGAEPSLVREIEAHDYIVSWVRFSPDGESFATASYDGTARVWDVRTGRQIAALTAHSGEVRSLSFHPSGRLLATASADVATVWDLDTVRPIVRFRGHAGRVVSVAFAPDGSFLASGGDAGVIKLWDTHEEERSPRAVARAMGCLVANGRGGETDEVLSGAAMGCARVVHRVPEPAR